MQKTLSHPIVIEGHGLHSGCKSRLVLNPAPINHGVVFCRTDLPDRPQIPALYSHVVDTRNCTCLGDNHGNVVSTVEHLMAALAIAGVDNTLIEVNAPEIPIMDSSALAFFRSFVAPGVLVEQNAPKHYLKIKKTIELTEGDKHIKLSPSAKGQVVHFTIDFPSPIVGHQEFAGEITPQLFEDEIAPCRTFCEKSQVDYLQSLGLIKGGSLENAVVLDNDKILNPEGFRVPDECVSHKVMDAVGDLYTSGYHILGRLSAIKSGHYHNNELLKKLFSNPSDYELL